MRTARLKSYLCLPVVLLAIVNCGGGGATTQPTPPIPPTQPTTPPPPPGPIVSGSIEGISESNVAWIWGDTLNNLCQLWSVAVFDSSGHFYGTNFIWSNADVFVLKSPADPLTVVDAENFDYSVDLMEAAEGDTVFFRGRNGFFGAWQISDIGGGQDAVLSGTWYFKSDGGGDFTQAVSAANEQIRAGGGDCDGV